MSMQDHLVSETGGDYKATASAGKTRARRRRFRDASTPGTLKRFVDAHGQETASMALPERETGDRLDVKFDAQGLVPAIVQDADDGAVLMVAWMNRQALERTVDTGQATFYSRSRGKAWAKGESSGHVMHVIETRVDCDQDVILLRVSPGGAACHVGYRRCFYRAIEDADAGKLKFVADRVFDPAEVYGK
jgi:phosphoribosyl-AMP cyclohydrolase